MQDLFSTIEVIAPMTPAEAQGWKTAVGNTSNELRILLFEGYEREAWRALGYDNWTDCLQSLADDFGFTERRLWQLHAANQTEQRLLNRGSVGLIPERQLRPLAMLEPEQQREAWREAETTAPNGKITAAHVQAVVDRMTRPQEARQCPYCGTSYEATVPEHGVTQCPRCNELHSYSGPRDVAKYGAYRQPEPDKQRAQQAMGATVYSHNSLDYYTPRYVTDAAREVMGGIDLDPASCEMAQRWINAGAFYTIDDDGLRQNWFGRIWLNPPYSYTDGRSNQDLWSDRLVTEYSSGNVQEGLLLVKAALGYKWFERLWDVWPVCFMRDRLSFVLPDGTDDGQSKQATAIFYIGPNVARFAQVFSKFGRVILPEDQIIG